MTTLASRRLFRIALAYLPVPIVGTILTLVYDVPAHPGGDPLTDAILLGTAATPPLVTVTFLLVVTFLARSPGRLGLAATLASGLVGLAFLGGATINLPNDFEAARSVGFPIGISIVFAAYTVAFASTLLVAVGKALAPRIRRRRAEAAWSRPAA